MSKKLREASTLTILIFCTDTNRRLDDEGNTSTRSLGLLVARGTLLVLISPVDGSEEIENPFVQADDDDD